MASEIDAAPGSSITSPSSSPTSLTLPSMLALSSATSPALMDLTNEAGITQVKHIHSHGQQYIANGSFSFKSASDISS
ncbi:unnamed protein product [Brassica oleracea]